MEGVVVGYGKPLVAKSPELDLALHGSPPWLGRALAPLGAPTVCIGVFGRWAGDTMIWVFVVLWRGRLDLFGWPRPALRFSLVCNADPLMGPL